MNTINSTLSASVTNTRPNKKPSPLPGEKQSDIDNDKRRQSAVDAISTKQQKELTERFVKATVNANQTINSDKNVDLGDLQEIAQLGRRIEVVQAIDENDASKIKEVAETRREKIENFFREMNNPEESAPGRKIDRKA